MNALDLDAIKARCEAASPGPWEHYNPSQTFNHTVLLSNGESLASDNEGTWYEPDDAEFVAHAREDIPALVAEVERLRAHHDTGQSSVGRIDRDELAEVIGRAHWATVGCCPECYADVSQPDHEERKAAIAAADAVIAYLKEEK